MTEPDLFSYQEPEPEPTHEQRFEKFHAENPKVFAALVTIARQRKALGFIKYGINRTIEDFRWNPSYRKQAGDDFKINNNHAPFYARLIMERCPDLRGFFEVRSQRSADKTAKDGAMT